VAGHQKQKCPPAKVKWLACCALILNFFIPNASGEQLKIRVGGDIWRPYFLDPKAEKPGFGHEIIRQCLDQTGYEPQYHNSNISRLINDLETGATDMWVMSKRPGREAWLYYTALPLFQESYGYISHQETEIEYRQLDDLKDKKVGLLSGVKVSKTFQQWVAEQPAQWRPQVDPSEEILVRKLVAKRLDVIVNTLNSIRFTARQLGVEDQLTFASQPIRTGDYYVVLSRKSTAVDDPEGFLGTFNECLHHLQQAGEFARLGKEYGLDLP